MKDLLSLVLCQHLPKFKLLRYQRMSRLSVDGFKNFFRYWDNGIKQNEALEALYAAMPVSLLEEDSTWIDLYRTPDPVPESVLPQAAVELICEFEGFRPTVYDDGVGVATIGYGSTFYDDGRSVCWNDSAITEPQARRMMEQIAEKDFWNVLRTTIPYWEEMTDGQRGALLSFGYNLGAHFFGSPGFNTISAVLRDRAWDEVPNAFRLYVNPGSAVEAGLRRRREAEIQLWTS
jgi:GH24 family phage-related lysozyme (muramidase)